MHPLLEKLADDDRRRLRLQAMPSFTPPMLATLSKRVFSDPAWVYEAKLDGQRSLLWKRGSTIRLLTRNQKDRTSHYPDLTEALSRTGGPDLIADGEIVTFRGTVTSFQRLQERMQNASPTVSQIAAVPVLLYVFDLIWLEGYDLSALPLRSRKAVLQEAIAFEGPVRFSDHLDEDGEVAFRAACATGWEGLIAKRADAPYVHGRSGHWLKLKCVNEQELVVLGWTDPQGARSGLGALLVGYHEEGQLRFAGKVGTGFGRRELDMLGDRLVPIERPDPPVAATKGLPKKGAHWVRPELVVQVGFGEWTDDGKLRHPRYLGLRNDKLPEEIVREPGLGDA